MYHGKKAKENSSNNQAPKSVIALKPACTKKMKMGLVRLPGYEAVK